MRNLKFIITCVMFGTMLTVAAQKRTIKNENQQWIQYYNILKFNAKWALLTDGGYRWKDELSKSSQYIARMAVNYSLNPNMSTSFGVAHLGFYNSNKLNWVEFRPYQEFNLSHKYSSLKIHHRYRVEERYFYKVDDAKIQSNSAFNFRLRYRIMLNFPILKLSSTDDNKILSMNIGDEIMLNAGSEIIGNVFDQNRILIGPALKLSKSIELSVTYSGQLSGTKVLGEYNYAHVIWVAVKQNINLMNTDK